MQKNMEETISGAFISLKSELNLKEN